MNNSDRNDAEAEFKLTKATKDQDYESWRAESWHRANALHRRCEEYRVAHRMEGHKHYGTFVEGQGWIMDHQGARRFDVRDWHIREAARLSYELRTLLGMTPEQFREHEEGES